MKNKIKAVGYVLGIALSAGVFGTALQFAKAWTEPAAAPPSVSIGAPLTTGSGAQTKTGYVSLAGAMQTPYLYDSDNTSYYLDPNNTSKLNHLNTAGNVNATGYIEGYDGSSVYGILNYAGYGGYFNSIGIIGGIDASLTLGSWARQGQRIGGINFNSYNYPLWSSSIESYVPAGAAGVDFSDLRFYTTGWYYASGGACNSNTCKVERLRISSEGYATFFQGHNDLAENYLLSGKAQRGSLVSIDQAQFKTGIASDASHQAIVGIVSTAPGAVMDDSGGFQIGAATKNEYENEKTPIALQGTAPTLVTSQNGNIAIGDAIGISNTPGFGSKMTTAGTIVGKALEKLEPNDTCQVASSIEAINWPTDDGKNSLKPCFKLPDGTIVGKIMVAVNVSWSDPTNFAQKIWAEIANLKDKLLNHEGRLTQLEQENSALKNLVCADHPQAAVCLKN